MIFSHVPLLFHIPRLQFFLNLTSELSVAHKIVFLILKHKIVKHKKYYEIYNNVILEALPYKAVNIDSTQKFIVEI